MKLLLIGALASLGSIMAQTPLHGIQLSGRAEVALEPLAVSTNYAVDLEGLPDTRPGTWGSAGVQDWKMPFHPPAGYRARILRVYGDWIAWTRSAPPAGTRSGVLFGLQATTAAASKNADFASDGCMLFLQGATDGSPFRAAFDQKVVNGLLGPDNVLVVRAAVFLNDLGMPIHIEPSFVIEYRWEKY